MGWGTVVGRRYRRSGRRRPYACGPRDPRRYFEDAVRLLQRICDHDGRRPLLFLDELGELAAARHPFGDPGEVMNLLRSVLQDSASVTCLFAGSVQHMMRDLLAAEHRAFYQWGSWFELELIEPETWRQGIERRARRAGVTFEPVALARLVELGEGQARTTMVLAQQAYVAAFSEGRDEIDVATEQIRLVGRRALDVRRTSLRASPPTGRGPPTPPSGPSTVSARTGWSSGGERSAGVGGWSPTPCSAGSWLGWGDRVRKPGWTPGSVGSCGFRGELRGEGSNLHPRLQRPLFCH